jgi:sugar O-acyltransferase (sialic acid O-acetyltransferase NeuD family)
MSEAPSMTETVPLVIYGNGILADLLLAVMEGSPRFRPCAVTADAPYVSGTTFRGLPLLALEDAVDRYPPARFEMMVAVGYRRMRTRREVFARAKSHGYRIPSFVAPGARVYPDLEMGEGNIVFDNVYLGPGGRMGSNNVIRPQTYVGHGFRIGDHVFVGPRVAIGGRCRVGTLSFVGLGSTVIGGVTVAEETLVGAAALVLHDTEPCGAYLGHPARKVREHAADGVVIPR